MQKRIYWEKPKSKKQKIMRLVNIALVIVLGGGVAAVLATVSTYWALSVDLPKLDTLNDYKPNIISFVYDNKKNVVGEFKYENQRRILIGYDRIPEVVVKAIISSEDAEFWTHKGLDYTGMVRALLANLKTMKFSQGASTITQQVTRSLLLSKEKKLVRKLKEMILAQRIEKKLSKKEILTLYLNEIYFGNGAYGILAAAQNYFDKDVTELNLAQAALLAGLPQAPSKYSPYWNSKAAKVRQKYVLNQMTEEGYITEKQALEAQKTDLYLKPQEDINLKYAPYFIEHVRKYVMKKYGTEKVLKEGLKIYTTLDVNLQWAADKAVDAGLRELDKRQGWRGVVKTIDASKRERFISLLSRKVNWPLKKDDITQGLVVKVANDYAIVNVGQGSGKLPIKGTGWIRFFKKGKRRKPFRVKSLKDILAVNDVIEVKVVTAGQSPTFSLEQPPATQAALLAMEPRTRYVRAIVGGSDFVKSPFNRAIQARRQPGSSFKPVVYAAAMDAGMTPATIIDDTALVFKDGWRPGNYDGKFRGRLTLRQALTKSVNTVTIRLVDRISADYVYRYAHRLGITGLKGADLSMALGTYEIPPIELINAYATFAGGGLLADPIFITKIETASGEVLEEKILSVNIATVSPMENVPDVSQWGTKQDLEQGAYENSTTADPIAKEQFYNDFGLKLSDKEKQVIDPVDVVSKVLHKNARKVVFKQVISPQTAYLITSILHSVATRGTGARSNALGKVVAGKTGTTNDYVDAWFIGFSPDILAGVWVGNDKGSLPILRGESGSSAALPIWIKFMKTALTDKNADFKIPKGITVAKIDPKTGLLANPGQAGAYSEYFKSGTEPIQYAPTETDIDPEDFFEADL